MVDATSIESLPKSNGNVSLLTSEKPVNIKMTSIASWLGGTKSVDDTKLPSTAIFDYVKYYKTK